MKHVMIKRLFITVSLLTFGQSLSVSIPRNLKKAHYWLFGRKSISTEFFTKLDADYASLLKYLESIATVIKTEGIIKTFEIIHEKKISENASIATNIKKSFDLILRTIIDANHLQSLLEHNPKQLEMLNTRVPGQAKNLLVLHKQLSIIVNAIQNKISDIKNTLELDKKARLFFDKIVRPIEYTMNLILALTNLELTSKQNQIKFFSDTITNIGQITRELVQINTVNTGLGNKPIWDPNSQALKTLNDAQWATWDIAKWATITGITIGAAYYAYNHQSDLANIFTNTQTTIRNYVSRATDVTKDFISQQKERIAEFFYGKPIIGTNSSEKEMQNTDITQQDQSVVHKTTPQESASEKMITAIDTKEPTQKNALDREIVKEEMPKEQSAVTIEAQKSLETEQMQSPKDTGTSTTDHVVQYVPQISASEPEKPLAPIDIPLASSLVFVDEKPAEPSRDADNFSEQTITPVEQPKNENSTEVIEAKQPELSQKLIAPIAMPVIEEKEPEIRQAPEITAPNSQVDANKLADNNVSALENQLDILKQKTRAVDDQMSIIISEMDNSHSPEEYDRQKNFSEFLTRKSLLEEQRKDIEQQMYKLTQP